MRRLHRVGGSAPVNFGPRQRAAGSKNRWRWGTVNLKLLTLKYKTKFSLFAFYWVILRNLKIWISYNNLIRTATLTLTRIVWLHTEKFRAKHEK